MRSVVFGLVILVACNPQEGRQGEGALPNRASPPPDSMVLRMADGAEVWYTGSMLDTAVTGETCNERTVEIRRAGSRTPVPLLYTLGELEAMDDTTVRAALMRDCAKLDTYLVNTRTAQPRRVE